MYLNTNCKQDTIKTKWNGNNSKNVKYWIALLTVTHVPSVAHDGCVVHWCRCSLFYHIDSFGKYDIKKNIFTTLFAFNLFLLSKAIIQDYVIMKIIMIPVIKYE